MSQNDEDSCSNYKASLTWTWFVLVLTILAAILILCFGGCTDRIHYHHEFINADGKTTEVIDTVYTEGVGNSEKRDINAVLPDKARLTVKKSITNQDKFMDMLMDTTKTLASSDLMELLQVWMATQPMMKDEGVDVQ